MFERIKSKVEATSNGDINQKSVRIAVVGPRASGKTAYMAAIARFPHASNNSVVKGIEATSPHSEQLIDNAKNILEEGLQLEPTRLERNVINSKDYEFLITFGGLSQLQRGMHRGTKGSLQLVINFRDYAGEFFEDLLYRSSDPLLNDYLEDCGEADGIMLLLDGSAQRKDINYAAGVEKLLKELTAAGYASKLKRIALVLTKCEQTNVWMNRENPRKLAQMKYAGVYAKLNAWQASRQGEFACFAASAFGVMGDRFPEPNAKLLQRGADGIASILKDANRWRPFGLVSPMYWIGTGNRNQKLDEA